MSNVIQINPIESALVQGDLSKLTPEQRMKYYKELCDSLRLNMLTRPFDYLVLNNKLVLYAKKDATDQLRSIKKISITKLEVRETESTYEVIAHGKDADGREDSDMGVVDITGLKGANLANAKLKCVTKAKRRLTLSLSGLGLMDESEVESIPEAKRVDENYSPTEIETEELAHDPGNYAFSFGKFKDQRLKDLDPKELKSYCEYIVRKSEQDKKPIQGIVKEALEFSEAYLNSKELTR